MTATRTDLQAALRKACEEAAKETVQVLRGDLPVSAVNGTRDIIERHLTPVFEALRVSVIEECAEIARPVDDVLAGVILKLKGAPR